MNLITKLLISLLIFLPLIVNADVVRCKFGSSEFTIILPPENNTDRKYLGHIDTNFDLETFETFGIFEIGKVIDDYGEKPAIIVNNHAGWREVIWLEHREYSRKINWDPTGLRKEIPQYDYENTTPEERLKQHEELKKKNKDYAEYSYGTTKREGVCK